jgi:hypothetical protein
VRKTARWEVDEAIPPELFEQVFAAVEKKYPGRVRRALLVCPVAVEKVIDNESDARETLRRLAEGAADQTNKETT